VQLNRCVINKGEVRLLSVVRGKGQGYVVLISELWRRESGTWCAV